MQADAAACSSHCSAFIVVWGEPVCGNGVVEGNEECDNASPACKNCKIAGYCGDGMRNGNEACDDGNTQRGDGCSDICTIEPWCGDGILDPNEGCDDGNTRNGDGCTSYCLIEDWYRCNYTPPGRQGDDSCDSLECDAARPVPICVPKNVCGNGIVDSGEQCDDGNALSWDGCDASCQLDECGNGIIDPGETCDDGADNGDASICSRSCDLKWFATDGPKCSFIDPPSIQRGEYLPFWWGLESHPGVRSYTSCNDDADAWAIAEDSMICEFLMQAPDGQSFRFSRPCKEADLANVAWYNDLQRSVGTLEAEWWQSYLDTSLVPINDVYGEFTISLEAVDYSICVPGAESAWDAADGQTMSLQNKRYDNRVCQYNIAVTTPYMMQQGITLSSAPDDIAKLWRFLDIDGNSVLDNALLEPIANKNTTDIEGELREIFDDVKWRAVQNVTDVTNDLAKASSFVKKVPADEIYYVQDDITIDAWSASDPFNDGKPTTVLVEGPYKVDIEGSLYANLMVIAPEGTINFVSENCDTQDFVQGIYIAKHYITTHYVGGTWFKSVANIFLDKPEWCDDGSLVVEGIMIGGRTELDTARVKQARRSTLDDWFDSSTERDTQIYDGSALRVRWWLGVWDALPPLAKSMIDALQIRRN